MSGTKKKYFKNQAGEKLSYPNYRLKLNKENLAKLEGYRKNFKSLSARLKKSESIKSQEDHELTLSLSISKRSQPRNMIMSTALLLTTLSSVQALEDKTDQSSSKFSNIFDPNQLTNKKEISGFSSANSSTTFSTTTATFNQQVKKNLLTQDDLSKTVDSLKIKSASKKPLEEFKDEDLLNLITKEKSTTEIVKLYLLGLNGDKNLILKSLTKIDEDKFTPLLFSIITKNDPALFKEMLFYVDDSESFSKLITSCGSQQSHSFLNYAFTASSSEFIDIIDQQITRIAHKEASKDKSIADIRKQLWQKALRQKGLFGKDKELYPLYIAQGKPQNIKKILAIAKKFGDEFLVEILNQENLENKDTLLILESFHENHDSLIAILDSLKDNKDALLKVLTKTNTYEDNSLTYIIFKKNPENFATMLSYVDDSESFSKLIISCGGQESRSFFKCAFDSSSSEFIDIIDQQITRIAQKEVSKDKSSEDIYKELWQKALRQVAYSKQNILKYPLYYSQSKPQNIKKILAIAKKFGDEFLVEILNQENLENKDTLLIVESFLENHDSLIAILDSLKDNKDKLLKVLTKTNIFKYNSLVYIISKESPQNFATMLSYVDDSESFSKLITSCGSQESHSFLNYAFAASSSEFIDIIDQQITRIAQKEASKDKSIADIRKELWQKALRQKGLWNKEELYPLYIAQGKPQNIRKILAIAKKFGDEFLVEILNQENLQKNSLLIVESFSQNNESIGIIFDSIKDNKDALNKVMIKKNKSDEISLNQLLKYNSQYFKTFLSYVDDNSLKELLQNSHFLTIIFGYGRYDEFDIFLDMLALAKKSGTISLEDIQKSVIFQHKEFIGIKELYWLSGISHSLMVGNEKIAKKLLELNDNLSIEEFPKKFMDENIDMVRYYVEQIQKNEEGLGHIKVEHLVYEDVDDELQEVRKTQTKPEDFALVDGCKTFAGFRVVDSKSGEIRNIISLRIKFRAEELKNLKIIEKLISKDAVDKIIISLDLKVSSLDYHRTTLCLTKDQKKFKGFYHNPNGYDDTIFQEKFINKTTEIFHELGIEVNEFSPTEVIVFNDSVGSCSVIGSIVSAVWVLGQTCEDKIRSDCHKIIESKEYKVERNFKREKCIDNISQKWNREIQQKLAEKLQQIKQSAKQKPIELTSKQTHQSHIIRGHNGIVSEVYDEPSNKISVMKEESVALKIASKINDL